jgi:glycyl-tRNA synthetase beta chain
MAADIEQSHNNRSYLPKKVILMDLLIDIYSEETPARMQRAALSNGQDLLSTLLTEQGLSFTDVGAYISPMHFTVFAKDVPLATQSLTEERRGPRENAPEAALSGFLKSTGMTIDQLVLRDGYYYAEIVSAPRDTAAILPDIVHAFLGRMPWPKTMRWHNPQTNDFTRPWIRPIRALNVMMDDKPVIFPINGLDLETSNKTYGHRFLKPGVMNLTGLSNFKAQMRSANIIVDFEERRTAVWDALSKVAAAKNLTIQIDDILLDEVTGLVDFPYAHLGEINDAFMHLPAEVLSTSMRVHQKYFTLRQSDGTIAPYFGVITNVPTQPSNRLMLDGLERVLRARLSDALFFYDTDKVIPLTDLVAKLDSIIFHEKLGSVGDKIRRLQTVTKDPAVQRAAFLCKSDLVTHMVGEFPELQGVMGKIYATLQGEAVDVALALEEHYQPLGPSKKTPTAAISRALALIDKMDTLVGLLGSGIKPTGSKDPLAIRRTALGIIRLIVENDTNDIDLKASLAKAIEAFAAQNIVLSPNTIDDVIEFITLRFHVYLRDRYPRDVVDAVLNDNATLLDMWKLTRSIEAKVG